MAIDLYEAIERQGGQLDTAIDTINLVVTSETVGFKRCRYADFYKKPTLKGDFSLKLLS